MPLSDEEIRKVRDAFAPCTNVHECMGVEDIKADYPKEVKSGSMSILATALLKTEGLLVDRYIDVNAESGEPDIVPTIKRETNTLHEITLANLRKLGVVFPS